MNHNPNPALLSRRHVLRGTTGLLAAHLTTLSHRAWAQGQSRAERLIVTNSYIADIVVALGASFALLVGHGFPRFGAQRSLHGKPALAVRRPHLSGLGEAGVVHPPDERPGVPDDGTVTVFHEKRRF